MMIQTASGKLIDLMNLRLCDIDIIDIAHSLSMQCRFNGHTFDFYSVAEHSVLASRQAELDGCSRGDALGALMHDSPEAYIGDMAAPIKEHHPSFVALEESLMDRISESLNIPEFNKSIVKEIDLRMLAMEKYSCLAHHLEWPVKLPEPATVSPHYWPPSQGYHEFIKQYKRLMDPEA